MRALAPLRGAVPAGGRRSKPSPLFFSLSSTRFRPAARGGAGLKTGVPFPAALHAEQLCALSPRCAGRCRPVLPVGA